MEKWNSLKQYFPQEYNVENSPTGVGDNWQNAVLVLIINEEIFFIKRSFEVPSHKGQVAFIGGKREAKDNNPLQAALREFEEETHLDLKKITIEFIGYLPHVYTSHNQILIPVLANLPNFKKEDFRSLRSNGEWDVAFGISIQKLLNESAWYKSKVFLEGRKFDLQFFSPRKSEVSIYSYRNKDAEVFEEFVLWGASAKIVRVLLPYLKME